MMIRVLYRNFDKDDMTDIFLKELFVESDEEDALEFAFKLEYEDRNQKK